MPENREGAEDSVWT